MVTRVGKLIRCDNCGGVEAVLGNEAFAQWKADHHSCTAYWQCGHKRRRAVKNTVDYEWKDGTPIYPQPRDQRCEICATLFTEAPSGVAYRMRKHGFNVVVKYDGESYVEVKVGYGQ